MLSKSLKIGGTVVTFYNYYKYYDNSYKIVFDDNFSLEKGLKKTKRNLLGICAGICAIVIGNVIDNGD